MNFSKIIKVSTALSKKRQVAILETINKDVIYISPNNISQNTSLAIFEIELLIGSKVRIEYYSKGEKMFKGICQKDNSIVKDYFFDLLKPIEKLRIENNFQLLPFLKISKIFNFHKFNQDNVGIELSNGKVIYMSQKRFDFQSKLDKNDQFILVGSYVMPQYYAFGEILPSGMQVRENNKVLKSLNLRYSGNYDTMFDIAAEANGAGEDDNDYIDPNFSTRKSYGPESYGYKSWDEMNFYEAYEGRNP